MSGKQFLIIIIITFVTTCIWAAFNIVYSRSKVQIAPEVQELIEPIEPNFDTDAINEL